MMVKKLERSKQPDFSGLQYVCCKIVETFR